MFIIFVGFCFVPFIQFWSIDPMTVYRTVVEEEGDGAFLSKHPSIIWKDGSFEHKPWMTGVVPNEGVVRSGGELTLNMN